MTEKRLFFDTETTGFAEQGGRICQLAAVLTSEYGRILGSMNVLIQPDGWSLTPALTAIHGITTEDCKENGIPLHEALGLFSRLALAADFKVVAHNVKFDMKMLEVENKFFKARMGKAIRLEKFNTECTMEMTKNILKLPFAFKNGKVRKGIKYPKLTEAYFYYYGKTFAGAHDAMNDVMACRDVYYCVRNRAPKAVIEGIDYVCGDCAEKNGGVWPEVHAATFHTSVCPSCRIESGLASVGDWNWPNGLPKKWTTAAGRD